MLEALDLDSVHSEGYSFQIELTYRALRRGFVVREIPIIFVDRRAGQSKMSSRIFWKRWAWCGDCACSIRSPCSPCPNVRLSPRYFRNNLANKLAQPSLSGDADLLPIAA